MAAGVVEAERVLIEKGLTPKDAREISTFRVFGGANGGYVYSCTPPKYFDLSHLGKKIVEYLLQR